MPREDDGFADRFKKLLDDRGLSVRDLAEIGQWSPSTVQRWRSGQAMPRPGRQRRMLCNWLETTPGYLFRGEDDDE
jgi:transcriptional regulator with XRE-family HTH domain